VLKAAWRANSRRESELSRRFISVHGRSKGAFGGENNTPRECLRLDELGHTPVSSARHSKEGIYGKTTFARAEDDSGSGNVGGVGRVDPGADLVDTDVGFLLVSGFGEVGPGTGIALQAKGEAARPIGS